MTHIILIKDNSEKYNGGAGSGLIMKQPGAGDWVPHSTREAAAILQPSCPDGGMPVAVLPGNEFGCFGNDLDRYEESSMS